MFPRPWLVSCPHGLVLKSSSARTQQTRPSSGTWPCRPVSWCRGPADAGIDRSARRGARTESFDNQKPAVLLRFELGIWRGFIDTAPGWRVNAKEALGVGGRAWASVGTHKVCRLVACRSVEATPLERPERLMVPSKVKAKAAQPSASRGNSHSGSWLETGFPSTTKDVSSRGCARQRDEYGDSFLLRSSSGISEKNRSTPRTSAHRTNSRASLNQTGTIPFPLNGIAHENHS